MRAIVTCLCLMAVVLGCVPAGAQVIYVELVRPASDDLGHYVSFARSGSQPIMGFVASELPVARVTVSGVPAMLFPANYSVIGAPVGLAVTGFRARAYLDMTTPLRVTVTDQEGNYRDAAYLPDSETVMQRLQFLNNTTPYDVPARVRLANANAQIGNADLAAVMFDPLVEGNPGLGVVRHLRALALADYGRIGPAIEDLEWLVTNVPDAIAPRMDLAALYGQQGLYNDAIVEYETVLESVPQAAEAHYLLGETIRFSGGDLQEAALQQDEALLIDPTMAPAYYEKGIIESQQGDWNQGLYNFRRAIQQNPRDAQAHLGLAMLRYNRGDYRRAWRALERATRWGAVPDPFFVAALMDRMNPITSFAPPLNFQRPPP